VQLTLLMITVIQLTSSQPANNNQELTQLKNTVYQLVVSNSHLTTLVSLIHRDVIELKNEVRARGKLCYFGSEYNFNPNFNFNLVRGL